MGEFDNTVAVVTNAARGQGRSHAVALAQQDADVIVVTSAPTCRPFPTPGAPTPSSPKPCGWSNPRAAQRFR